MAGSKIRSKATPKKRPRKVAANGNGHAASAAASKEYQVITLRIERADKSKLLEHCAKRAKQEGKQMSFNRAIIEWIQGL